MKYKNPDASHVCHFCLRLNMKNPNDRFSEYPFQVIPGHGNPQKRRTMLAVIYSNVVALNTRPFTRYVRRHPIKKVTPKSYLGKHDLFIFITRV